MTYAAQQRAIEDYERCLEKNTVLERRHDLEAYMVRIPGNGRMGSFMVCFTSEGIAIMGDWAPCHHGVCSVSGYGRRWFAGELSPSYLAEKFLRKVWVPEYAAEELRDPSGWLREDLDDDQLSRIDELCGRLEGGDLAHECMGARFYDDLSEIDHDLVSDGIPGMGYRPGDLGMLVAIQRKFAELHAAEELSLSPASAGEDEEGVER